MFYLIKDMFNPINWIKLIKDPKNIYYFRQNFLLSQLEIWL